MTFELWAAGALALAMMLYLIWVLLHPERF
jgi:K+-transporting ATPase, KdpF subunit